MSRFNLSDWALKHQNLVLYFMLLLSVVGALSYGQLGQSEDPPFSFKVMVVRTQLPGASADEVAMQVTDPVEKKLQEIAALDNLRSFSRAGESTIILWAKDDTQPEEISDAWYQVRKKISDIKHTLPNQVQGPFFNDEFGDVFGNMYALLGDGYSPAELKRQADLIRAQLLQIKDVAKVRFFGEQNERIFLEVSNAKLATLGISTHQLISQIQTQNLISPAGEFNTSTENIKVRVTGDINSVEKLNALYIAANGQRIRLTDVAKVSYGYEDPPSTATRFMGTPALFIGVSMRKGGDIIALGKQLNQEVPSIEQSLPVGLSLKTITSQPETVKKSVQEFVKTLAEAVIIVLAVSLLSLGWRTGIVVAIVIPVVLAITFLMMYLYEIGLHKISLGALILSLGLLVDDAIIAVEMMASKMEQGMARVKAAAYAYQTTAMPMLTGTLVTAAGFLPIATAASTTGEYTRSIFQVTVIALLISWVAAVTFVPYLGYHLLPDLSKKHDDHESTYHSPWYQRLRRLITWVVKQRWVVIILTVIAFVMAIIGFGQVQQQFFPDSTRPELIVDLRLTEGASYRAADNTAKQLEAWLDQQIADKEIGVENYVTYIGTGSPRFYLPLDQQLQRKNFAEFVITAKDSASRELIRSKLIDLFNHGFPNILASVFRLENGPPVGFPVQFRVSGPADFESNDYATLRAQAEKVAAVMRDNQHLSNVQFDWQVPIKSIQLEVDQAKAKTLGVDSTQIANFVNGVLDELNITEFRYRNKRIDLVVRGTPEERKRISRLGDLMIKVANNQSVPLSQLAKIHYTFEEGLIWKRDRIPTITVSANVYGKVQAPFVSSQVEAALVPIKKALPLGYKIAIGGAIEESAKGSASVAKGAPLFIVVVLTILMIQLQSFSRVMLVLLTAPMGIIGVTIFLLLFNQPFGFVAMLGTIALSGMIMRNSVILVEQIAQDQEAGVAHWQAIVESTVRRFRPIVLTAAASVLAMIPLSRSAFFGPMAVAIMGGLFVATILTIVALPAIYAAWYRVKIPKEA